MALLPGRQVAVTCLMQLASRNWLVGSRQIDIGLLSDMASLFFSADTGALSGGVIVAIIFGVFLFIALVVGFLMFWRK